MNQISINKKNVPNDLSNLISKVDKLDIGKLETSPVDLSKLSNVVKNNVAKNTEYDELIEKFVILILLVLMIQLEKLTITQKLMKLKRKLLIMILINILLLKNLIKIILQQD